MGPKSSPSQRTAWPLRTLIAILGLALPACGSSAHDAPSASQDYPGVVTVSELDADCIPTTPALVIGWVQGTCSFCAPAKDCPLNLACWGIGGCSTIGRSCGSGSDHAPVGGVSCCDPSELTLPFCPTPK